MPPELEEAYDRIYRYCYFRTKDAAAAEDLTQETFLRVFSQNPRLGRASLNYLYTIARNLCIDRCREKKQEPLDENLPVGGGFEAIESADALERAVAGLPPEQQELLLYRYADELKMEEIGRLTGLSRFAVRRKLKAALKTLRQTLRKEDFF